MRPFHPRRLSLGSLLIAAAVVACDEGNMPMRFALRTPREDYEAGLRQAGLEATALGREWARAAALALTMPVAADLPFREARYLDATRAAAVAYRVRLQRGQRLALRIEVAGVEAADFRLFIDLFHIRDSLSAPELVAAGEATGWEFEYVAMRPGPYVLRLQPELLRGGRVTVTVSAHASLGFPVAGRDLGAVRSGFGAVRDGGRRQHHGLDIFAARGTPVIAAVAGRVTRVSNRGIGGNVVWLREERWGRRLYYAHLDRHAVVEDTWVRPGDTLGFVGNTGNARTTPPHLHFGIYLRGEGPVDPYSHLFEPRGRPPEFTGDLEQVGRWARVAPGAEMRAGPSAQAGLIVRLTEPAPVQVLAGTGRWYLTRLPDGREAYLSLSAMRALEPLEVTTVASGSLLRDAPTPFASEIDSLPAGSVVPILGWFGGNVFVRHPSGVQGWLLSGEVIAKADNLAGAN
jgi:murein DD-endopeptidase MepM/ murein hydrolase activator NlpD